MANSVWRIFISMFGICAIAWTTDVILIYRADGSVADNAQLALSGDKFNAVELSAMKRQLDAAPDAPLQASSLTGAAIIRLLLLEASLREGNRQPPASEIAALQTVVDAALARSPTSSFMWLTDLWLKRLSNKFVDSDWNLLRMSYWSGPNEAWIAVRRNSLALGIFPELPSELAEEAISEFVGLVRSGLYAEAANILAGPGWGVHEQLLGRLTRVDEVNRHEFAKTLASKNIEGAVVPGEDQRPTRPF
jgi:hypothetical protein